jgi:hypothetical protein
LPHCFKEPATAKAFYTRHKMANGITIRVELADTQSRVEHARLGLSRGKIENASLFGFCVSCVTNL